MGELLFNEDRVSVLQDGKVLELMVALAAQRVTELDTVELPT